MKIKVDAVRTGDFKTVTLPPEELKMFSTVGEARKYYKKLLASKTILLTYTEYE